MSKKRTFKFEIKKSKNKRKTFIKVTAGNGEPFLSGQLQVSPKSAKDSILSMIEAIKEGRYEITTP